MSDHRATIAALPAEMRVALTARSDRAGLTRLAIHLALIAVPVAAIAAGVPGWPLLWPPLGIALIFLFTAHHEAVHGTAFATGWLNAGVARICGLVLILPTDWFRYFHLAHHRHTQDPLNDPELRSPKPDNRAAWVWHVSGLPVWRGQIGVIVKNAAGRCEDPFVPAAARGRLATEARAMLAVYGIVALVSLLAASPVALTCWLVPVLVGQPFLRLYLLAEHGRCPFVADMLQNSRTTYTNRLVRLIAWNMPFHAEHHAMPTVPFHRLPALNLAIAARLGVTAPGYRAFTRKYLEGLEP